MVMSAKPAAKPSADVKKPVKAAAKRSPRGLRLPIDFFLRSMAQDQREAAIGMVLSGMGSDGTLGLRASKEMAGLALAQEKVSAKFDSMPRSVIDAGLADIVKPPEQLPEKIINYLRSARPVNSVEPTLGIKSQCGLEKIIDGLVITLSDITEAKTLKAELRKTQYGSDVAAIDK
jgi:hypothetical protein